MEEEKKNIEKTEEKKDADVKSGRNYIFRILGGGYLLYTSYSIMKGIQSGEGDGGFLVIAAAILFVIVGIVFIVSGIRVAMEEKSLGEQAKAAASLAVKERKPEEKKTSITERANLASKIKEEETEKSEE